MGDGLRLGTWAAVDDDCPLHCVLDGDGNIELRFGERSEGFEVILTPAALERLLPLASAALIDASSKAGAES